MNKKALTEADIRTKFITPALVGSDGDKWDVMTQIREETYFTKGRVIVRGKTVKRGAAKMADYLLFYKPNIPLAVIEAKDNNHSLGAGMPQALEYAEKGNCPLPQWRRTRRFHQAKRALRRRCSRLLHN
jgi:type I restriction enzyme, R subunit